MSMSKEKKTVLLKIAIYTSGVICLYAFIAVRSVTIFNLGSREKLITGYWDNTKYGELYYFNYVKHFKEKGLPQVGQKFQFSAKQAPLSDADMLIFGDSFFDMCRPTQFPIEVQQRLKKNIHFEYFSFPLSFLNQNNYQNNKPKLLILESVERYIATRFMQPQTPDFTVNTRSPFRNHLSLIKDKIFDSRSEELYDALLKRSYLTTDAYSEIATLKFDLFGYISKLTPKYSFKDTVPWIYYHEEVNSNITSFYYQYSDEQIEQISENILLLSTQLKEKYNLQMVFIPVPSKYTICHNRINDDKYNEFLPRLQKKLDEKGVKYIDFYHPFKASKELLYIPTDTHWSEKGLGLAVQLTMEYLEKNNLTGDYPILSRAEQ